jgi:hypothetical protein
MNELQDGQAVSLELMALVPLTLAESELLAASIERAVQEQTGGAIANLAVVVEEGGVFLHGSCSTYYHKQLAQHAAMAVPAGLTPRKGLTAGTGLIAETGLTLTNCIEVD